MITLADKKCELELKCFVFLRMKRTARIIHGKHDYFFLPTLSQFDFARIIFLLFFFVTHQF